MSNIQTHTHTCRNTHTHGHTHTHTHKHTHTHSDDDCASASLVLLIPGLSFQIFFYRTRETSSSVSGLTLQSNMKNEMLLKVN